MTTSPCLTCACNSLPRPPTGTDRLFVWFPSPHVRGKGVAALRELGIEVVYREDADCVVMPHGGGAVMASIDTLAGALGRLEATDTRVLLVPEGRDPSVADLGTMRSLQQLASETSADWLVQMIEERRITSHFQPVVAARDPTRLFGFEALLRGVDPQGGLVPPVRLLDAARDARMLFQLDLAARRSALMRAAEEGIERHVLINFTPTAIYDPKFCLRSTTDLAARLGLRPERIVFEVIESEHVQDVAHVRAILDHYRGAGFKVALDDVGAGYASLNMLHRLRPDVLKLDMDLVRGVDADPYKAVIAARLIDVARDLGILTIAEGVETPEEHAWLVEHGADFVQGYLFGRPAERAAPGGGRAVA